MFRKNEEIKLSIGSLDIIFIVMSDADTGNHVLYVYDEEVYPDYLITRKVLRRGDPIQWGRVIGAIVRHFQRYPSFPNVDSRGVQVIAHLLQDRESWDMKTLHVIPS